MNEVRVLLLEDSEVDSDLIALCLKKSGLNASIDRANSREGYEAKLRERCYDIVLSDFQLPSFDGTAALALSRELAPDTPFIFVSGIVGEEFAIESLKQGAVDYVLKQRLARLPGAVERALAEARERTERRKAEDRLRLLVGELSHRVKNTLATVSSIARLTLKRSESLEAFETAFLGRLNALAEAHGLIFKANWGDTELSRILERTVAPFARDDADFRLTGPPLELPPKPALSLSLVFHELATNAVKYGALSREGGYVEVSWEVDQAANRIKLRWREHGGPTVSPPRQKGFGAQLIERSTRYELDGRAVMDFAPDGLDCRLEFPGDWAERAVQEDLSVPRLEPAKAARPVAVRPDVAT